MAEIRKQPYGYKIEFGKIVVDSVEAEYLKRIFQMYRGGASLSAIAKALNTDNVAYDTGRQWNKNNVARVLENKRYVGVNNYPAIISRELFSEVMKIREGKQPSQRDARTDKVLCCLIGNSNDQMLKEKIVNVLNNLVWQPCLVTPSAMKRRKAREEANLRQEWKETLDHNPIDESRAVEIAYKLIACRYGCIGDQDYETERIRRCLSRSQPSEELNIELLKSIVAEVEKKGQEASLLLKNGQRIEGECQM